MYCTGTAFQISGNIILATSCSVSFLPLFLRSMASTLCARVSLTRWKSAANRSGLKSPKNLTMHILSNSGTERRAILITVTVLCMASRILVSKI